MKITVVGAGAMGSLFGALLAESGAEVQLLDIWDEHVRAINAEGLQIEKEGRIRTVRVQAFTSADDMRSTSLAILFVKSMHTASAARSAARLLEKNGMVLTLQNGMGHVDRIVEAIHPGKIIAGTTSHGATLIGPAKIRHAGTGPTTIGGWFETHEDELSSVAGVLNRAGIQTSVSENVKDVVWDKLLVNVGINAITALAGIKNGQLLDLPVTKNLSKAAVEEAIDLARAHGVRVRERAVEHVFRIAAMTAGNRSSMGQDVDRRRPTEIGAINGFVVRESEKLGMASPVNCSLTALIETMQHAYGSR